MQVFKLRHKPTGLFFVPGQTTNLTKKGKLYGNRPGIKALSKQPIKLKEGDDLNLDLEEWELCEFVLDLTNTIELENGSNPEN